MPTALQSTAVHSLNPVCGQQSLIASHINIHTADTIQSSLCAGSCNNHCASEECGSACTSHPKDRDWTHSRTAIIGFNVGYHVKEREIARPWRSQRCVYLKMLEDTAMADGRHKYSTGGVVLKILRTYSMEQSPSREANRFSSSQEIPCILWIPKVHYCIHKCSPHAPTVSEINPVHALTTQVLKVYHLQHWNFKQFLFVISAHFTSSDGISKHMKTELPNDGDKRNNVTVCVCWKWKDTVTRHDRLQLLFSQWRKQMGEGTAEQQERMLRHNCDQWRIPCPSTRTEMNNVLLDNKPEALTSIQPRSELKLWIQNTRN